MKDFYSAFIAKNGKLYFFNCIKGLLYEEIKGKTFEKNPISTNSSGKFSVCAGKDVLIFSVSLEGSMDFFRKKGHLWKKQTLIKRGFPERTEFKVLFLNGKLIILSSNKDSVMASRFVKGIWESPVKIGKGDYFKLCGTGKDFFIMAIKESTGDIYLKKVLAEKGIQVSESLPFIKNAERILDISFLVADESLFCAYIVKTMFSVQIWFKEGGKDKKEIFVWEGIYADKVLLFMKEGTLFVLWTMGNTYMFSELGKESFSFSEAKSGKADFGGKADKAYFMDISGDFDFISQEMLYGKEGIPDIFVNTKESPSTQNTEEFIQPETLKIKGESVFTAKQSAEELAKILEKRNEELYSLRGKMQIRVRELNKIIEELKEEIKILKEKDVNPQKEET